MKSRSELTIRYGRPAVHGGPLPSDIVMGGGARLPSPRREVNPRAAGAWVRILAPKCRRGNECRGGRDGSRSRRLTLGNDLGSEAVTTLI
jgi:hypothetical protein